MGKDLFELSGSLAVVTGGSRGIGRAVCLALANKGARVVVNYASNRDAADEVVKCIVDAGGEAFAYGFNVAESDAVSQAFEEIITEHGSVGVLVNNAGIAVDGLLVRTSDADWQRTLDVNLTGSFLCARAAVRSMIKARQGRIVNISSVIGLMGNAGQCAYAATKSALFGVTKSLARELAGRSITVNAVAPGFIETDMTSVMTEAQREAILQQIPLSRLGRAEDVANLVAFLASEQGGYITGQVLSVNGGLHM